MAEGLEDVYGKIVRTLHQGYQKQKEQVRKIFQIIAVAVRPLLVSELEFAVAIRPACVTDSSNLIVNFEMTLPVICGSLVEFVTAEHGQHCDALFAVREREAHMALSTICLSYIMYDLPSSSVCRAVSGKHVERVKASFLFVAYVLHWSAHANQGLRDSTLESVNMLEMQVRDDFYSLLIKFLSRPLSVTAWMETSWIFGWQPSLIVLSSTGTLAATLLREFPAKLEQLSREWSHLLGKHPQATWRPSITAFSDSPFWYQTKDTIVSSMLPTKAAGTYQSSHAHRPILVKSQLSASGKELGVAIALPSRAYLITASRLHGNIKQSSRRDLCLISPLEKGKIGSICSSGWRVGIQRRDVRDEKPFMNFNVELSEPQIFSKLQQSLNSKTPHRLSIPVSFSHDLNRLAILRTILAIRPSTTADFTNSLGKAQWKLHCLDLTFHRRQAIDQNGQTILSFTFTPNASAFGLVSARPDPGAMNCRTIQVWSDVSADNEVMSSQLSWHTDATRDTFAFHPTLPLIVYSEWKSIVLWRYNDGSSGKECTILNHAVTFLGFSEDGTSLQDAWVDSQRIPSTQAHFASHPLDYIEQESFSDKIDRRTDEKKLSLSHLRGLEQHSNCGPVRQRAPAAVITSEGLLSAAHQCLLIFRGSGREKKRMWRFYLLLKMRNGWGWCGMKVSSVRTVSSIFRLGIYLLLSTAVGKR
ncbi:hypothetical protein BDW59DRAFT_157953 [Aspergillus cavernicola]|uniref:Uncharacterized protein n=1 Tax=Aspergillus cavernicola TaxID=176166 RepID=A0ABR4IVB7_9EURO